MTEDDTFKFLKRKPMGKELLESVFSEPKDIDLLTNSEFIGIVNNIHDQYYNVKEFYDKLHDYHITMNSHYIISDSFTSFVLKLTQIEKELYD